MKPIRCLVELIEPWCPVFIAWSASRGYERLPAMVRRRPSAGGDQSSGGT
jgi:hypothetical protein